MRRLGKGLSQLMGEQLEEASATQAIAISRLQPNPRQPRKEFAEEPLQELVESIKRIGILQPIVVRPIDNNRYEIIAGERRWRAATLAGLEEVPVVIRTADTSEALQLALVENIQREDISPLECAEAYQMLISEFGLTQDDVARRVGKSRPAVANSLRLLRLPLPIRESLAAGKISEGHARALLQFDTEAEQLMMHSRILERGLNVRAVEHGAQNRSENRKPKTHDRKPATESRLDSAISEKLGAPARIVKTGRGGKIEVEFFGEEDLGRILDLLDIRL